MNSIFQLLACASLAVSGSAFAQEVPRPPGMPEGPHKPGAGMGESHSMANTDHPAKALEDARTRNGQVVGAVRAPGALRAKAAKPEEVVAGAPVTDMFGKSMGTISAVDHEGAVVSTPAGAVRVPIHAFGKSRKGLLLDMAKERFDALVAQAAAAPAG